MKANADRHCDTVAVPLVTESVHCSNVNTEGGGGTPFTVNVTLIDTVTRQKRSKRIRKSIIK